MNTHKHLILMKEALYEVIDTNYLLHFIHLINTANTDSLMQH